MRAVLLGPPGVGKGTQGRRLARLFGSPLISTGEILRETATRETPQDRAARQAMDAGLLVADETMIELVRERTARPDSRSGFVLDGFPRTVEQARSLDAMLAERGEALDTVLFLAVEEEELVRRLAGRRECPVCKRAYNVNGTPSRDGRHCDDHPAAELQTRADDAEEAVRRRFEQYSRWTAPLVDYYRSTGRLRSVAGTGTVDEVFEALRRAAGFGPATPATT